ncbi:MAG: type II toxin-antitoxin system RelE/ParE family toxin [Xanthomonadaceae bacterium]|jgi:putative addiction module killer protein|nr:type II toxin-antitoxin system RelE/ParE family toxin [Xanthomonadaceae bacterium]
MQVEATRQFKDWLDDLKDLSGRSRIQARIQRLADGNPGQHRVLTGGVCEMKIDVGPGYRVYYTQRGVTLVILLVGGDKKSQDNDVRQALELASNL